MSITVNTWNILVHKNVFFNRFFNIFWAFLLDVGYRLVELTSSGLSFDFDSIDNGLFHLASTLTFPSTYNVK